MSADKNHRVSSFDNVSPGKAPDRPSFPSPPEAQAMVDQALRMLGADPKEVTDPDGWRLLGFGTAHARINVVEWQPGVHFLAVGSPILRWPGDRRLRARMAEVLLRLNHSQTGMARFSIDGPLVLLSYVRPIHGLDLDEVLAAIRAVLRVADALDERMQEQYQVAMPQIDMDDSTWQGVLIVLRLCDDHTQDVFRHLMEGWVERKGIVDTGKGNIGLRSRAGSKTLAALVPYAAAGPLVTVGWDSLARIRGVLSKDVAAFKQAVPRPDRFETTKSSAHLPIDESFTPHDQSRRGHAAQHRVCPHGLSARSAPGIHRAPAGLARRRTEALHQQPPPSLSATVGWPTYFRSVHPVRSEKEPRGSHRVLLSFVHVFR